MRTRNITPVLHNVYGVRGNTFIYDYKNNYVNKKYDTMSSVIVCRTLTSHNYYPARHHVGLYPSYRTIHLYISNHQTCRFWVPYGRTHVWDTLTHFWTQHLRTVYTIAHHDFDRLFQGTVVVVTQIVTLLNLNIGECFDRYVDITPLVIVINMQEDDSKGYNGTLPRLESWFIWCCVYVYGNASK